MFESFRPSALNYLYIIFLCNLKRDVRIIYVISLNQKQPLYNISYAIPTRLNIYFKYCFEFINQNVGVNSL